MPFLRSRLLDLTTIGLRASSPEKAVSQLDRAVAACKENWELSFAENLDGIMRGLSAESRIE